MSRYFGSGQRLSDTLFSSASAVVLSACMEANPIIKNKNLIKIGWTLRIPYHWS